MLLLQTLITAGKLPYIEMLIIALFLLKVYFNALYVHFSPKKAIYFRQFDGCNLGLKQQLKRSIA
jgi:hypothetical protein